MLGRDIYEVGDKKRRGPAHILVVDDELHICRLLEVNLQRAWYRVTTVQSLSAAREVIATDRPDVIILDVWLPHDAETDEQHTWIGFEFSRELRENPATAALGVILLPLRAADDDVFGPVMRPLLARENRPYLYKPFNPMEVLTLVKQILDKVRDPEGRSRLGPGSRIF